jgi:hypothetical protein
VLPAGVGTEMGREPTAAANASAAAAGGVGRWSRGGTPSGTSGAGGGGTSGQSCHNLPLLGFLMGTDCIVHDYDIADKLWKCPSSVEHHALLQLGGETDHEAVLLLLVRVHLVRCILWQVVEQL